MTAPTALDRDMVPAEPCWGFHASAIPTQTPVVVDEGGRWWGRLSVMLGHLEANRLVPDGTGWGNTVDGHLYVLAESELLGRYGPVRCPIVEQVMAARLGAEWPPPIPATSGVRP